MTNSKKTSQKKNTNSTKSPQSKAAGTKSHSALIKTTAEQKGVIPSWIWFLIVIVVAAGGYWLIQRTNQRQQLDNSLPAEMSVLEVAKLDKTDWLFLDVREPSEWNEGHIEGATLIPLGQLEARKNELPTDQKIVVVCRSGNRSAQGRDILLKEGFVSVTSMAGGMSDWISQGLPVITDP